MHKGSQEHTSLSKKGMVPQFLEIATRTKALKHRLALICEHFEYIRIGKSQECQQGHARTDTPGIDLKPKETRSKL